jgi:hypothetical protein
MANWRPGAAGRFMNVHWVAPGGPRTPRKQGNPQNPHRTKHFPEGSRPGEKSECAENNTREKQQRENRPRAAARQPFAPSPLKQECFRQKNRPRKTGVDDGIASARETREALEG